MHILNALFNYERATLGYLVDLSQGGQEGLQLFCGQQANTLQHSDVCHRAQHIIFGKVEIHFPVFADRETIHFLIYLHIFLPKFLCHSNLINTDLIGQNRQNLSYFVNSLLQRFGHHLFDEGIQLSPDR